jgi:hypothetical protein
MRTLLLLSQKGEIRKTEVPSEPHVTIPSLSSSFCRSLKDNNNLENADDHCLVLFCDAISNVLRLGNL